MTLADAKAEVLSWLDPTRSPRIEWARYGQGQELLVAAPTRWYFPNFDDDYLGIWTMWSRGIDYRATVPANAIFILASTRGIDHAAGGTGDSDDSHALPPNNCQSAGESSRESVFAVFDAVTRERFMATLANDSSPTKSWTEAVNLLMEGPNPRVVHVKAPEKTPIAIDQSVNRFRWTPTPPPAPPDGSRIGPEQLPTALKPVFETYPLVPGSRFVWRDTHRSGGVSWKSLRMTESVVGMWLVAPDIVAVQSSISVQSLTKPSPKDSPTKNLTTWRYVTTAGIHGTLGGALRRPAHVELNHARKDADGVDRGSTEKRIIQFPFEYVDDFLYGPSDFTDLDPKTLQYQVAIWSTDTAIRTIGSSFQHCVLIRKWEGAGAAQIRWFCPGVGYVRTELVACNHAYYEVIELESWSIPTTSRR